MSSLLGRILVVEDLNEASRVARDNGYHNKVVTLDGQVINAGGSFTGGSVQRSAGLFTRKQEMEELRRKAAALQKDCLAAQEKTDQCKEQVDALQAELTATASEQITADNDRVRAEAEGKRLEAEVRQLENALELRRQEIDALEAALAQSQTKAQEAAALQAELTAAMDRNTAELDRLAQGSDSFLAQQNQLAQALSARRLEQVTRQKDAELAYSQIAALEQRAKDAADRKTALEESLKALADRSEACPGRDRCHPADQGRQPDHHCPKGTGHPGGYPEASGLPAAGDRDPGKGPGLLGEPGGNRPGDGPSCRAQGGSRDRVRPDRGQAVG